MAMLKVSNFEKGHLTFSCVRCHRKDLRHTMHSSFQMLNMFGVCGTWAQLQLILKKILTLISVTVDLFWPCKSFSLCDPTQAVLAAQRLVMFTGRQWTRQNWDICKLEESGGGKEYWKEFSVDYNWLPDFYLKFLAKILHPKEKRIRSSWKLKKWKSFELAFSTHDKDVDHKNNVLRCYLKTPFHSAPALQYFLWFT